MLPNRVFLSILIVAFATSLSSPASAGEMGHAFGLPHCTDGLCIMTRGFDRLNRAFTLVEPRSRQNAQPIVFNEKDVAYFAPVSATSLRASHWFQLDERQYEAQASPPTLQFDAATGWLRITAARGLRYVSFSSNGDAHGHRAFWKEGVKPPQTLELTAEEIRQLVPGDKWLLTAIDDDGTRREARREQLVSAGRFLRRFRFAKTTHPWTNHREFPKLSAQDLKQIEDDALAAAPVESDDSHVDFLRRFPKEQQTDTAGYAVLKVEMTDPQRVKLLAGSDDSLRIWLNGKVVHEKLALRSARPDQDQISVELTAGVNVFVIEVLQATGDWGLYLRFEDEEGRPIVVDGEDKLTVFESAAR